MYLSRSHTPAIQLIQAPAIPIGCWPEINEKVPTSGDTQHIATARYDKIKLELSLKLPSWWLTFMVPKGACNLPGVKNNSWSYPNVNPKLQYQPSKKYVPIWAIVAGLLGGQATILWLIWGSLTKKHPCLILYIWSEIHACRGQLTTVV